MLFNFDLGVLLLHLLKGLLAPELDFDFFIIHPIESKSSSGIDDR
jgi:hypothetical protein